MTVAGTLRRAWTDFASAMQFLTRIPLPSPPYEADTLARAAGYFPLVGGLVGLGAALLHRLLVPHVPRMLAAFFVLLSLVLVTGGLHEDGLADAADGFGGGASREKILLILRDSRIGTYGGLALVFSLVGRLLLLAALPLARVPCYLVAAGLLSRWTILPLGYFLRPARASDVADKEGQGARLARQISRGTLIVSTIVPFALAAVLLRQRAAAAVFCVLSIAWVTGRYYRRRIGGVTGDCFGATIQMAEMAVYLCGAWTIGA